MHLIRTSKLISGLCRTHIPQSRLYHMSLTHGFQDVSIVIYISLVVPKMYVHFITAEKFFCHVIHRRALRFSEF